MQTQLLPFNLDLLILTNETVKGITPITVLDIMAGSTRNFHPNGLFSTEIFGKMGDERRSRLYSWMELRIKIFHPIIFKALCDLKHVYGDILSGSGYATWDDELKDFIKCSPMEGDTGYAYFLSHFHELKFEERESDKRAFNIRLIEKYRDNCMFDKLIVMPAGLRDYEVDESGKPTENEINGLYRRVFSFASLISPESGRLNPEAVDNTRYSIQLGVNTLYEYITNLLEGKHKLILGKWAARRIHNGTRNVITSLNNDTDELGSVKTVGYNQTVVGLYQYMKAVLPVAIHHIRDSFLNQVFPGPNSPALLTNKKTLKRELVHIDPAYYDEWMTNEGLEKVITRFGEDDLRHLTLYVGTHYLGLIYKGPDGTFRLLQDIDEVPEGRSKKDVRPITFAELLYTAVFHDANTMPCFVTRYPVIGYGGIYPGYCYLKSTVKGEVRELLDASWNRTGVIANQFPVKGEQFINSMSPHAAHLQRLGADFDGDTCSFTVTYTDESKQEIGNLLRSRKYYVGSDGKMNFSASSDTIDYVLGSITG